jgi:hypothetical protein
VDGGLAILPGLVHHRRELVGASLDLVAIEKVVVITGTKVTYNLG